MAEVFQSALPLRTPDDPDPAVSAPLAKAQKAIGMVPNMYAAMANLPVLLEIYSAGYERFRAEAGFSPVEQEVVFLTISRFNECHYCVAAHSFVGDKMSNVPPEVTDAIRNDRPIVDEKLQALRTFTREMTESRGNPTPEQARAFLNAGYEEKHILGIILAIAVKVISNYSNHLFHTEVDPSFADRAWTPPS
jgi:uncharacterized peroxidase-related enzyme